MKLLRSNALKMTVAKLKSSHNGLRHSFISYRVAAVQDVGKVALEAGDSPQMIFKHYRELVGSDEAKVWFSIVPQKESGVLVPLSPPSNSFSNDQEIKR